MLKELKGPGEDLADQLGRAIATVFALVAGKDEATRAEVHHKVISDHLTLVRRILSGVYGRMYAHGVLMDKARDCGCTGCTLALDEAGLLLPLDIPADRPWGTHPDVDA